MLLFDQNPVLLHIQTWVDARDLVTGNTWGAEVKSLRRVCCNKFLSRDPESLVTLSAQENGVATHPTLACIPLGLSGQYRY